MRDPLRLVHDDRLRLTEVTAHVRFSPVRGQMEALSLSFGAVTCIVVAEDDDSLTVTSDWTADPALSSVSLSAEQPWKAAIGKPLLWSWSMTNQQGYRDGLQLELAMNVSDDSPVVIQLFSIGSEINVRAVEAGFIASPVR